MRYRDTEIDAPTLKPDRTEIRGEDLDNLIGAVDPVELFALTVFGSRPKPAKRQALEALMLTAFRTITARHPAGQAAIAAAKNGTCPVAAIIAGLATGIEDIVKAAQDAGDEIGLTSEERRGVVTFGVLPALLIASLRGTTGLASATPPAAGFAAHILSGLGVEESLSREPQYLKAFEAVLVSLQAGLGHFTPTVLLPRVAAGTKADLELCVIAGFTACGRVSGGECDKAMDFIAELDHAGTKPPTPVFSEQIEEWCRKNRCTPGFGHRLFQRDPRAEQLRRYLNHLGWEKETLARYDRLCEMMRHTYGLHPNVYGLSTIVFLSLKLPRHSATGLLLCMRSTAMIAHALERRKFPACPITNATAKSFLNKAPFGWL